MERKRVSVQTPIGVLHAEVGMDEVNYPEIFIYLEREDGVEIDLVAAGVDVDYHITNAFLFGDTSTEESVTPRLKPGLVVTRAMTDYPKCFEHSVT